MLLMSSAEQLFPFDVHAALQDWEVKNHSALDTTAGGGDSTTGGGDSGGGELLSEGAEAVQAHSWGWLGDSSVQGRASVYDAE